MLHDRKPKPPFHTLGGVIVYDGNGVVAECESKELAIMCSAAPEMMSAITAFMDHRTRVFDAQMRGNLDSIPISRIDEILDAMRAALEKARGVPVAGTLRNAHESYATQRG